MSQAVGDPPPYYWGYPQPVPTITISPPRIMPVNVPFPEWSSNITIVTLDINGNVTIKTEQPKEVEKNGQY